MSRVPFGDDYARQYDSIYAEKDYAKECDLLEESFRRYGAFPIQSILDLGCGTGGHAIALAERGYELIGVDRSNEMVRIAREKARSPTNPSRPKLTFHQGDLRRVSLARQFDACLMMFAVLGYQVTNEDVSLALRSVRRHLRSGGLFLCDFWYGPAVLAIRPSTQVKEMRLASGRTLLRIASGTLRSEDHVVDVLLKTWTIPAESALPSATELHRVRYYFRQEIAYYLKSADLDMLRLSAMPNLDGDADESSWNVFAVARAT